MAQTWTVGVPAAFKWSQATYFGSSCSPDPDQNILFSGPSISGVQYVAIVDAVTPAGTNQIAPGGNGPLNVGDTVILSAGAPNSVYFPSGSGSMTLSFWLIGTPTTAGQSYPCAYNDLWMSNLMFCPEGLSMALNAGCTVLPGTAGVASVAPQAPEISFPSISNGWTLALAHGSFESAVVKDVTGRTMTARFPANMNSFPEGIYLFQGKRADGTVTTRRFILAR